MSKHSGSGVDSQPPTHEVMRSNHSWGRQISESGCGSCSISYRIGWAFFYILLLGHKTLDIICLCSRYMHFSLTTIKKCFLFDASCTCGFTYWIDCHWNWISSRLFIIIVVHRSTDALTCCVVKGCSRTIGVNCLTLWVALEGNVAL